MVVLNMPIRRVRRGKIWLPQDIYKPKWIVTIVDTNGDTQDVSSYCINGTYMKQCTDGVGNFSLVLSNDKGKWNDLFTGGEVVDIFNDNSDATTHQFRGKIDNPIPMLTTSDGWSMTIEGRMYPEMADQKKIIQFTSTTFFDCFVDRTAASGTADSQGNYEDGLLYNTGLTLQFYDNKTANAWVIPATMSAAAFTQLKVDFPDLTTASGRNDLYIGIFKDLCKTDYDWYIHYDNSLSKWYLRILPVGSVTNEDEAIIVGQNLSTISGFGPNTIEEGNKVTYIGELDGLIMLKTVEDTARQAALWRKDFITEDNSMNSEEEINAAAISKLTEIKESVRRGSLTAACFLPTLQPAELMHASVQYCKVSGEYNVRRMTVNFSGGRVSTTVQLGKNLKKLAGLFKERIDVEEASKAYENLNDMEDSINYTFDDDESSHYNLTNLELSNGTLKLTTGQNSGTLISTGTGGAVTTTNIDKCELRVKVSSIYDTENDVYYASNRGGATDTWEIIEPGEVHNFVAEGTELRLKIEVNGDSTHHPIYESTSLLYKTS